MGFPSTPILDDFNRPDEDPMTGWTDTGGGWEIVSNQMVQGGFDPANSRYDTQFNSDQEFYVTIVTASTTDNASISTYARLTTGWNGYSVGWLKKSGTDELVINRLDSGVPTQLGATILLELGDGDKLGFRAVGSTIEAWTDTGGGWTLSGSRTDSTYSGAERTAFYGAGDTTWVLDDFGGGSIISRALKKPLDNYMRNLITR